MPMECLKDMVEALTPSSIHIHGYGERNAILCALVASEEARCSSDVDICALFSFNNKLAPLAEKAAARYRRLVPTDKVNALVGGQRVDIDRVQECRRLKAQVECLTSGWCETPLVLPSLPSGLVRGIETLSDPPSELQPSSSIYWFLRFWHTCSRNGSISESVNLTFSRAKKLLLLQLHSLKRLLSSDLASHRTHSTLPTHPTGSLIVRGTKRPARSLIKTPYLLEVIQTTLGNLRAVHSLFNGVDYRSRLLDPYLTEMHRQREKLRLQVLDLDVDLAVLDAIKSETNKQIVACVAESSVQRRQMDRERKRDGFDPALEREFSLLLEVDELVGAGQLVSILNSRQKEIDYEVEASNLCDDFKFALRTQMNARRVVESSLLEEAERVTAHLDMHGIAEEHIRENQWTSHLADRRVSIDRACKLAKVKAASQQAFVFALEGKWHLSEKVVVELASHSTEGDPASEQLLRQLSMLGPSVFSPDIDARVADVLKSKETVDTLKYQFLRGTQIEVHCGNDLKRVLDLVEWTPPRRLELLYIDRRGDTEMTLRGRRDEPLSVKQITKRLDTRIRTRASNDARLALLCSDPAMEARFESCDHKTDDLFKTPHLFKESMYLAERPLPGGVSLDHTVRKRVKSTLTGKQAYFYLLRDDCSVPTSVSVGGWYQGHPSWDENEPFSQYFPTATEWCVGKSFSIGSAKFQQLTGANAYKLREVHAEKLKQYRILCNMIERAEYVGPLPEAFVVLLKKGKDEHCNVRRAMLALLPVLPSRMTTCIWKAARTSALSTGEANLHNLSFLVDIDAFFLFKRGHMQHWSEYEIESLPFIDLAILSEWAMVFLKGGGSPLSTHLGRPPLVYADNRVLIEAKTFIEAAPAFPSDFSYESMCRDGQLSSERVYSMAQWALAEDAGGSKTPWTFPETFTSIRVEQGDDVSERRMHLADSISDQLSR